MRAGFCKGKRITFDFVNQEPVWLYVQFTITILFGNDRVVLIFFRNRLAFNKHGKYCFAPDITSWFVKKITLAKFLFFIAVQLVLSNPEAFFCLSLLVAVAKIIVNKTSSLFEKGYGFVCLLIFQSGNQFPDFLF